MYLAKKYTFSEGSSSFTFIITNIHTPSWDKKSKAAISQQLFQRKNIVLLRLLTITRILTIDSYDTTFPNIQLPLDHDATALENTIYPCIWKFSAENNSFVLSISSRLWCTLKNTHSFADSTPWIFLKPHATTPYSVDLLIIKQSKATPWSLIIKPCRSRTAYITERPICYWFRGLVGITSMRW